MRGSWESTVTREVGVRPAHEPAHEGVEWLAEELEQAPGLLQRASDLGSMARPRMAQGAAQGVSILARPGPQRGPLFPKAAFTLDFGGMQVPCPGGQSVPLVLGTHGPFPAAACETCAWRAPCPQAKDGPGSSLSLRGGRTVPAEAARPDADAAWTGLAAETDSGRARAGPAVGTPRTPRPGQRFAPKPV